MKFNRILIVGLILAIFAIGAVSASDEMMSDENLTVDTSVDDSNIQIDDSNENISVIADDSEDIIGNDNANDDKLSNDDEVYCDVYDVSLDDEDNEVIYFRSYNSSAVGTLRVYVNNELTVQQTIDYDDYTFDYNHEFCRYFKHYYRDDLGITTVGDYTIRVTFNGDELISQTIHVSEYTFYFYAEDDVEESSPNFEYGNTITFNVVLPYDATGRLTLNVNGRTYDVSYKDGSGMLSLSTAGWNLGSYRVTAYYAGNNKYSPGQYSETIFIVPKIRYPGAISVGEKESITLTAPSGNGNMVIIGYKWDNYKKEYVLFIVQNVDIVNGHGSYSLASLPLDNFEYKFRIYYQIGSLSDELEAYIVVIQNSPGFSSSVTPTTIVAGNSVNVRLSGPKLNSMVNIYVDDSLWKQVSLSTGSVNEVLTGLGVGTHKIKVGLGDGVYWYSNTYYVTVKPVPAPKISLTLKKVKVKKSAKKLVLKVTLKINGKKVKGKTIKFKFNKKTYKARTNKKGVAKVTIKKKVLKKLKVGKKVKYQASFGKKTVKRTAKVKK